MTRRISLLRVGAWCLIVVVVNCLVWGGPVLAQSEINREDSSLPSGQGEASQPTYQEYANLISGNGIDAAISGKWVNPEGWLEYGEEMNQAWNRFEQKHLIPMRAWAAQEFDVSQTVEGTAFYPFSGPDAANILALFPRAKNYVLIGLEPVGSLPIFQPGKNDPFYESLEQSLSQLLFLNYFITHDMARDLVKKDLDGVLPVLMYFLGREKVKVLEVNYWLMQPDGTITAKPAQAGQKLTGAGIPGVKILFQRGQDEPVQTLYYFRFNLQDTAWRNAPQFVKFLKDLAPFRTFVKAASYLMFNPQFADIRQFVLDQSSMVLQTDEGIPLRYFEPQQWDRRFYGNYSCPIQTFAKCFQPDLAEMYRPGQNTRPLPFVIGYHGRSNSANLLLASRRTIVAKEETKRNKGDVVKRNFDPGLAVRNLWPAGKKAL